MKRRREEEEKTKRKKRRKVWRLFLYGFMALSIEVFLYGY